MRNREQRENRERSETNQERDLRLAASTCNLLSFNKVSTIKHEHRKQNIETAETHETTEPET